MIGFFSKKETESKSRPNGKQLSCTSCGLYQHVLSPKMEPFGNFKKGIMNIGEAPSDVDDKRGQHWQGKAGRYLEQTFNELGVDIFEDCINIQSVNCRPIGVNGKNRVPTPFELDNCRRIVLAAIEKYKPKVIILFGTTAIYSIIGHRWKKDLGGVTKWRGWTIPDQDFQTWICPTLSPSYVMHTTEKTNRFSGLTTQVESVEQLIFKQDIAQAIKIRKKKFPVYKQPTIEIITDLSVLNNPKLGHSEFFAMNQCAFDYETTGLKPHGDGHQIVCASIADSADHAYTFLMPKSKKARQPFIDFLQSQRIAKIAQNLKFEDTWSHVKLKTHVACWAWDTMLSSHIEDNRSEVTGLKFQNYVQFGVVDYDSEVAPYLKSVDEKNANGLNRILEFMAQPGGTEKVLIYCGHDSINEYRLAMKQRQEILPHDIS
jgi:uracil-DNA glycosylase family 4